MIITCPTCDARYEVDPRTFPAKGRQVRCARCREVWHAVAVAKTEDDEGHAEEAFSEPPTAGTSLVPVHRPGSRGGAAAGPARAALVPDDPPAEDEQPGEAADAAGSAHAAFRRHRMPAGRRSLGRGLQSFVLGAALALAVAAVVKREEVVRVLPASAGLYEAVGLKVNLRGLDFDSVSVQRVFEDGLPVLIVNGEVVNLRAAGTPVPALRFALRGPRGEELYSWTVQPRQRELEPRERMGFRSRLAAPPSGANDLEVRFSDRGQQSARSGR